MLNAKCFCITVKESKNFTMESIILSINSEHHVAAFKGLFGTFCLERFLKIILPSDILFAEILIPTTSRGVTRLDGARRKKQFGAPMLEPEAFRKQICC